jgi:protocatechuate 3,4-dioxygenase beta subunit
LMDSNGRQVLARYYTGPDGLYYFRDIRPGSYQLRAGGHMYPLAVQPGPSQDIGPIRMRF